MVETGTGRVCTVDPRSGAVTPLAEDLGLGEPGANTDLLPPSFLFNGITTDPTGTIYVTGDRDNRLYRIAR